MDNRNSWSCTFELEDIEIIDHKTKNEDKLGKWHCDHCSLFFLEKEKLDEHKKKHSVQEIVKCKYCNKTISSSSLNRECYMNRKCETCEYKCSNCPQRFLRHSSLMNHEKKHSSPKKKRTMNTNKKINGIAAENIAMSKRLKKKQVEAGDLEEQLNELKPKKTVNMKNSHKTKVNLEVNTQAILDSEKTPIKTPRHLSLKARKSAEGKDNLPVKTIKRLTLKTNKQSEEKNSDIKSKQNSIALNAQTVSPTSNVSNSENVVNYKPFSCHVCGDTFASDSALLDHIRTHGENAAKNFKCKFCGDEFDDIYKMQYHLAICPLAEDELESSLKQVIPANIPTKYSGGTSSPRKRGRPKRMVESPMDQEHYENEPTPSSKRGNFRKRKSEDKESNETVQNSSGPSLPKQSKKLQNKKLLSRPDSIRVAEDTVNDSVAADITEVTKESEPDGEKKKLHQCPFPRCDFKFTREKALLCHMRNHSDDFDDSLKCHKCDIPFDDIHTLRLHINTCKGIKEERDDDFNRADCYDTSPNRTFHRTKKDFVCNQCGRSYQNQEKLNRHLESCGSKFVCRICKDDFLNQPLLDEHFGSKHPPYTAYHCYICEEDFISELFLQIHQSDEHGQSLNTKPVQGSIRETVPMFPQRSVPETNDDAESPFVEFPMKSSSPVNMTPIRHANRIHTSPVTVKTGRYASRILTNSEPVATSRCVNRGSRYCWCPICLVGFDKRDTMRIHFRKKHVVENNSTYSCEICEVKMPLAEMMCYHLELHSSNLLSVNRFSKLIAYVKQNRVNEFRSSEVEIKCEDVSEDETPSQVKESVDITNVNKEKSTKTVHTQNKMVTNKTNPQQKIRYKPRDNLIGHQNSTGVDLEFLKENDFTVGSKTNIQNISDQVEGENTLNSVENSLIIDDSSDKTEHIHRSQNYINLEKPTRPLRSRARVNYSLQDKAGKGFAKQIAKLKKDSNEETCVGIKSFEGKIDTLVKIDYSIVTKETDSAQRQGQINRRVQQRKPLSLRMKKQNKSSHLETDTKASAQSNADEAIYREDLVKPKLSLIKYNKKIMLPVDKKILHPPKGKKNISSRKAKQLQNRNKCKQSCNSFSRNIENSSANIESKPNVEQLREENLNNIENSASAETFSINLNNNGSKDKIYDSPIESQNKNSDRNSDLNFELKELGTQSHEKNCSESTKGPFSEDTKETNEVETSKNVLSEDSIDLIGSGIASKQLAEVEYLSGENLLTGSKEPVHEESMASTTSIVGESEGICCTMCTESFFNQDELLDHLATHI